MIRVGSIVIRVDDLEKQLAFWKRSARLPSPPGAMPTTSCCSSRGTAPAPNVSLDRVAAKVQVPPKIDLYLYTEDQAGEVARLLAARRDRGPLGQEAR